MCVDVRASYLAFSLTLREMCVRLSLYMYMAVHARCMRHEIKYTHFPKLSEGSLRVRAHAIVEIETERLSEKLAYVKTTILYEKMYEGVHIHIFLHVCLYLYRAAAKGGVTESSKA